jgi:protein transport protein SEC24
MRLTLNYVPCSADMAKTSAMPLAVVLQPLALPGPNDDELPVG